jgi:hypothetical protein
MKEKNPSAYQLHLNMTLDKVQLWMNDSNE